VGDDPIPGDTIPNEGDLVRDEEDHDLLTFAEGGIRLREEIELAKADLAAAAPERRATLQARVDALTDALARNTRQAAENPGDTGFLSYRPARPVGAAADAAGES